MLGVGVGDASQRRGRRIEDLLQRLVLVGLVECLGQVDGYRDGFPPNVDVNSRSQYCGLLSNGTNLVPLRGAGSSGGW
jgi:hypothetical protein